MLVVGPLVGGSVVVVVASVVVVVSMVVVVGAVVGGAAVVVGPVTGGWLVLQPEFVTWLVRGRAGERSRAATVDDPVLCTQPKIGRWPLATA